MASSLIKEAVQAILVYNEGLGVTEMVIVTLKRKSKWFNLGVKSL